MMMMMMMIVIFKLVSFIPDLCNFLKFLLCARYCSRAGIDKTQSKTCFCKNKDLLATVMPIYWVQCGKNGRAYLSPIQSVSLNWVAKGVAGDRPD